MAIDDNTSYELTGAQVKDLAAKIKAADKPLYTSLGENTDGAMTQKAVREALYDDSDKTKVFIGRKQFTSDQVGQNSVGIGVSIKSSNTQTVAVGNWAEATASHGVALGPDSTASKVNGVAVGYHAKLGLNGASGDWSVALGAYASPTRSYEVNIGTGSQDGYDGANDHTRVLGGVHAGILGTDAVNVDQLTAAIPGVFTGTDGTTAGTSGLVPAPTTADEDKYLKGDGTWGEIQIPPARAVLYMEYRPSAMTSSFNIYKDEQLTEAITWDEMFSLLNAETGRDVIIRVGHGADDVYSIVSFLHESEDFGVVDANNPNGVAAIYRFHGDLSEVPQTRSKFVVDEQGFGNSSLVELSYGNSSWNDFITAYQTKSIVYCRASSNSNPATGAQTRKAFMAYVNNADNPTEVEFQYVRSVSSKTSSQPVDQVFVYKLTSVAGGTWTVQTRDMAPKLAAGTNASVSYSNGTYTVSATDTTYSNMTGASTSAAGTAGLVPAPAAGDQEKFLRGDGTWATGGTTYTAGNGISIVNNVISLDLANANNINY